MDAATPSSSATSHNLSLAQAVLTLSVDSVLAWLAAAITPSSYSSSSRCRHEAPSSRAAPAPPPSKPEEEKAAVDLDVVLAVMGAGAAATSVGFDEAAALFEEEEATLDEARAAFAVFDRDGDGFIDAAELAGVLRPLGFACADGECRRMIDAYDEDRDGRIGFREFLSLMERTTQQ